MSTPSLSAGQLGAEGEESEKPSSPADPVVDAPSTGSNVADWNGPDDPENPLNWSPFKKNLHVAIVSLFTLTAFVLYLFPFPTVRH